jgi:hypothetical protein
LVVVLILCIGIAGCSSSEADSFVTYTNQRVTYPLPVYPGADEASISAEFSAESYDVIEFLTSDSPEEVTAWHDEQLRGHGWGEWVSHSPDLQLHLQYPADADLPGHTLIFMARDDFYNEGKTHVSIQINHSGG